MDGGRDRELAEARSAIRRALIEAASLADILEDVSRAEPTAEDWLHLLARIGRHESELSRALSLASEAIGLPAGARDRILQYLLLRVGQVVEKEELDGVAGISEWARRVRELRDDGWRISTNSNREDLRPGQYVLESAHPRERA